MGFDGKSLVHPGADRIRELQPSRQMLTPILHCAKAVNLIAGMGGEEKPGVGRHVALNGQLVEALHVEAARRVLARGGLAQAS